MTERKKINEQIDAKKSAINQLQNEIVELERESLLLCDDEQWYEEKIETIGRGKTKRDSLIGRIHWMQDFKDESTGEVIAIERQRLVRVDGEWQ